MTTSILAMTRRLIGAVATRGRMGAMAAVALVGILIGVVIRNSDAQGRGEFDSAAFLADFGLVLFVPLVALVVASATLGTLRDERTLVYFWLRPIHRWQISAASLLAGLAVLVPLILVPMLVIGLIVGDSGEVQGIVAGAAIGLVAYTSVFTMIGLVTKRALAWGLVYILIWEGIIAGFSDTAGRFAIRTYSRSILSRLADAPNIVDNPATTQMVLIVTACIAIVSFALTTFRLNHMTID